jgi:hypothetical protein
MLDRVGKLIGGLAVALCVSGCVGGAMGPPRISDDWDMGGQYLEPWLGNALKAAEAHPLGSKDNPVRADMPGGQRAYLSRLRCADNAAPGYRRSGNLGAGVFGSIVDAYDVHCEGAEPVTVVMDMYFRGYTEARAVEGFRIVPP